MRFSYSFDLHLHTHFSHDCRSHPKDVIAMAKKRGLSGLAITDHDTCEGVEYLKKKGFLREDGHPVDDFLIIPGVEVSTSKGHLLCLGTTLPLMKGEHPKEVIKEIHARGGIAIAPHPFDQLRAGLRRDLLEELPLDAIETFNAAVSFKSFNKKAALFAQEKNLPSTAASDAHHPLAVGVSHTTYSLKELTLHQLLQQIKEGGTTTENYLSFQQKLLKQSELFFRFFYNKKNNKEEQ